MAMIATRFPMQEQLLIADATIPTVQPSASSALIPIDIGGMSGRLMQIDIVVPGADAEISLYVYCMAGVTPGSLYTVAQIDGVKKDFHAGLNNIFYNRDTAMTHNLYVQAVHTAGGDATGVITVVLWIAN